MSAQAHSEPHGRGTVGGEQRPAECSAAKLACSQAYAAMRGAEADRRGQGAGMMCSHPTTGSQVRQYRPRVIKPRDGFVSIDVLDLVRMEAVFFSSLFSVILTTLLENSYRVSFFPPVCRRASARLELALQVDCCEMWLGSGPEVEPRIRCGPSGCASTRLEPHS